MIGRCDICDLISFSILNVFSVLPQNPLNKYIATHFKFKKHNRNKKIVNLESLTSAMGDWEVKSFSLQIMFR